MKARLARTAGFCMGVRRAMELALSTAHGESGEIATYGPLIHNPQALDLLETKGVRVIREVPPAGSRSGGTVIIRAHGVPPEDRERLAEAGYARVVDGTCPRVIRVQAIIGKAAAKGQDVVIAGDADHPEVVGLLGHARGRGNVVSRPEEVADLPDLGPVTVVAQTTQNPELFAAVVEALQARFGEVAVHQTICEATFRRQDEVSRLAAEVDGLVVVGGRASGNTKRLAELGRANGIPTWQVETEAELDRAALAQLDKVGVTAGASTPNWMIKRVLRELGAIRSAREPGYSFWARRVFRFLVRSQLLVAVGAAAMAEAACLLQGHPPSPLILATAFFYIYAMHVLNHFLDKEAGQYNDPDRAYFLTKHRRWLVAAGILAGASGLALCAVMGWVPLILVGLMSALGLLYSVPFLPRVVEERLGVKRLKDIPGSKTLSAATAWAFIVALLPAVALPGADPGGVVVGFLFTWGLVLARCALFDTLDVQGDLVVGKETIPIVLGAAQTARLLWGLLGGLAVLLVAAPLLGLTPYLAWALILPVAGLAVMQLVLTRAWMVPGSFTEGLVDLNFCLAGAAALLWRLI